MSLLIFEFSQFVVFIIINKLVNLFWPRLSHRSIYMGEVDLSSSMSFWNSLFVPNKSLVPKLVVYSYLNHDILLRLSCSE